MNEFVSLAGAIAAMWLVFVGIAVMVRGPRAGATVFMWPLRTSFRLIRRMVGGLLIALGEFIRG